MTTRARWLLSALAVSTLAACAGGGGPRPPDTSPVDRPAPAKPGQTSFTSEDQSGPAQGAPGSNAGATPTAPGAVPPAVDNGKGAAAPAGRTGQVEEGDIYKVVGNRLYYLNTYKGFLIYDVTDTKKPARLSRLPVFGYPVEMFVEGNTVFALLRDSLYLTPEKNGQLAFARHNVSQLVTIDVADPAHPRVLKTLDIVGQLREGVARKIENTIYVVSYWASNYWWGWAYENQGNRQDQAWVYAYDVKDPANPVQRAEQKIFEGGAVNFYDPATGASFNRNFSAVYISATSNALMVVENWYISASGGYRGGATCGYYNSDQQSVVSIIDISDPTGVIKPYTHFATPGSLTDQFKQTYVHDDATGRSTYFGIFARQGWSSQDCSGQQQVQNTIEAWDVTDGSAPRRVSRLDFGKPNETVRGTAFDPSRQVAYAITARQIDPLYAISIADPTNLKVLSAIDGLAGDISVFRLVGDNKFLLAVGRDASQSCTGFDVSRGDNNIAVSIIDVQSLTAIRLVQRQCVKIDDAAWVGSNVTWDLDQAHKMLGMHSDGNLNVITVPVSYWKRNQTNDWWYDNFQTAVGIMSWDLTRYDPSKGPTDQTVIANHGTFIHPNGEVRRSVLFTHAGSGQRMMANLSDTHISLANLQDLDHPALDATVEVAPYLNELFRFGGYIVEEVQPRTDGNWYGDRSAVEFRVKAAGGELDDKVPAATFLVGQAQRAVKHGNQLVVFRYVPESYNQDKNTGVVTQKTPAQSQAVIFDLTDPTHPVLAGKVDLPQDAFPYYRFYCGDYFGGYWWGGYYGGSSWADTAAGLVMARQYWDPSGQRSGWKLMFLDLRDGAHPTALDREITLPKDSYFTTVTVDGVDAQGFYLGYRTYLGQVMRADGAYLSRWRDYASRWELAGDHWAQVSALNVPGQILRTFRSADNERIILTSDYVGSFVPATKDVPDHYVSWTRVSLLREIQGDAAELLDARTFENLALSSLVAEGDKLFVNGQRNNYYYFPVSVPGGGVGGGAAVGPAVNPDDVSDRLMVFDLAAKKLTSLYDQPTHMTNVLLMGFYQGRLFVNLAGDGLLIVDVSDPAHPTGQHFERTLGYATHIEFVDNDAYIGSGFFGTTHIDLQSASSLVVN